MALFIGNLARDTRENDVRDKFEKFGSVVRCNLKDTFGFIEFKDPRDAEDAIRETDGSTLLGNKIKVEWSKGRRNDRGGRRNDGCYNCGKPGHFARNCRSNSRRSDGGRSRDGYRDRRRDSRDRSRDRSSRGTPPRRRDDDDTRRKRRSPDEREKSPRRSSRDGDRSSRGRDDNGDPGQGV